VHAALLVGLAIWVVPTAATGVVSIVVGPVDELGEPWLSNAEPLPKYALSADAAAARLVGMRAAADSVMRRPPLDIELNVIRVRS